MSLHFEEIGNPNLPTIVLIHAYPLNHHFWVNQLKGLSHVAHLIALDLPGFGKSPPLNTQEPMMSHYVDTIVSLLQKLNIPKAIFVGCSLGGYVLFEIWRKHPDRVQGLIFCNTKAEADGDEARAGRFKTIERVKKEGNTKFLVEEMIPKFFSGRMIQINTQKVEQVKDIIRSCPSEGVIEASHAMASRPNSIPTLSTINVPTLILSGTEDPITGENVMKPIREGIKGIYVSYVLIKDGGHLSPIDSPEQTNDAIISFLKEKF